MNTPYELQPAQLRRIVDPSSLLLQSTADLVPIAGIIGQERAAAALQLGLNINDSSFNIYVAGPPGVGKMTATKACIAEVAQQQALPPDWCYVNNFEDPSQPMVLQLPAGRGRKLHQDMQRIIERIRQEIPKAFESDEYHAQRDIFLKNFNTRREALLANLNERANQMGFGLQAMSFGLMMVPVIKGRPINEVEFQALPLSTRETLLHHREMLQDELKVAMKQVRDDERTMQEQVQVLDQQVALYVVGGLMEDVQEQYRDLPAVHSYLQMVQQDIIEHIATFSTDGHEIATAATEHNPARLLPWAKELPFRKYQVNVLVDNSKCSGAPVVVEHNPTYANLFGRIEKETLYGALYTDFTMIKAGALHRANGGYLVLPIEDLLRNPFSWDGLKRALRSGEIDVEELGERLGFIATRSLQPQPIPLKVKVVLLGSQFYYYLLHSYDELFPQLFKIKADFDTSLVWNDANLQSYLRLLATFCRDAQLKHLDASAVAQLLEHAARMANDQYKLSTCFGVLTDLIREANFWATQENAPLISAAHVRHALDQKVYRSGLIQQHIQEQIASGTLLIDTDGVAVGQVNGLAVIGLADYSFGKPSRITASVGPGRGQIVDIEREANLGGALHSKGICILSGYLTQKYAQDKPLALTARLGFEQSYEGVEGDSASAAELYALLSALANVPLKQSIAVTGSVNQHGMLQAIGGINEKIEGFFDVCASRGLTGAQGVLIPRSNLPHLMLREDVVVAVQAGQFHIWAVETIDQGIEILSGRSAGVCLPDGRFLPNSINARVDWRLRSFSECLHEKANGKPFNGASLHMHYS